MVIIDPETRLQIIKFLQNVEREKKTLREIQHEIYIVFKIFVSLKTVSNYISQSENRYEKWLDVLEEQNNIMSKWLTELKPEKVVDDSERLAEDMFEAFTNHDAFKNFGK